MDFVGMLRQAAKNRSASKKPVFNPRPAGQMIEGCTAHEVLGFLSRHPGAFFTRQQLIIATGRSQKAVDWALIYLKQLGKVRSVQDAIRNPRYLRYTCVVSDATNSNVRTTD